MAWCFTGELLNTLENSFKYCLSSILFHFFLFFVFLSLFLFYFVLSFSVFVCLLPKSTVILFYRSDPVLGAIILIVCHPGVWSVFHKINVNNLKWFVAQFQEFLTVYH